VDNQIGWHNFRHSLVTNLRAMGVDVKVAQELLRHANSQDDARYLQAGRLPTEAGRERKGGRNDAAGVRKSFSTLQHPRRQLEGTVTVKVVLRVCWWT
jgi:hypothetical protein